MSTAHSQNISIKLKPGRNKSGPKKGGTDQGFVYTVRQALIIILNWPLWRGCFSSGDAFQKYLPLWRDGCCEFKIRVNACLNCPPRPKHVALVKEVPVSETSTPIK